MLPEGLRHRRFVVAHFDDGDVSDATGYAITGDGDTEESESDDTGNGGWRSRTRTTPTPAPVPSRLSA